MRNFATSITGALIAGALVVTAPAAAQPSRDDQQSARKEMRAGNAMSARQIERRVVPRYTGADYEYLGFEYDKRAVAYRLKFIRDGRVKFVDVDARSGRIINESR